MMKTLKLKELKETVQVGNNLPWEIFCAYSVFKSGIYSLSTWCTLETVAPHPLLPFKGFLIEPTKAVEQRDYTQRALTVFQRYKSRI